VGELAEPFGQHVHVVLRGGAVIDMDVYLFFPDLASVTNELARLRDEKMVASFEITRLPGPAATSTLPAYRQALGGALRAAYAAG
jgi:hypothetical protein